jgi:hypothetical protein
MGPHVLAALVPGGLNARDLEAEVAEAGHVAGRDPGGRSRAVGEHAVRDAAVTGTVVCVAAPVTWELPVRSRI